MTTNKKIKELREALDELAVAFDKVNDLIKTSSPLVYERWKAGGKAVSNEFVSMYPLGGRSCAGRY